MPYPIILVPGIARFDVLGVLLVGNSWDRSKSDSLHYFRKIGSFLEERIPGLLVFRADSGAAQWAGPVVRRAAALRECVERVRRETGAPKVHLIAHSMGGLDARHMLYDFQYESMQEQVASISTV